MSSPVIMKVCRSGMSFSLGVLIAWAVLVGTMMKFEDLGRRGQLSFLRLPPRWPPRGDNSSQAFDSLCVRAYGQRLFGLLSTNLGPDLNVEHFTNTAPFAWIDVQLESCG